MAKSRENWYALRTARDAVGDKSPLRWLYDFIGTLICAMVMVFVMFGFFVRPVRVEGSSMMPNFVDGDWLLVNPLPIEPKRGQVVVLSDPGTLHKPIIKRTIGLPGQTIDFAEGKVLVDGSAIFEAYIPYGVETVPAPDYAAAMEYPAAVPDNTLFVMGDNRTNSTDSRRKEVGFVPQNRIVGTVFCRLYPTFAWKPAGDY